MKIDITKAAQQWFQEELGLSEGSGIHFSGKVYGKTEVHEGFSVGMAVDKPGSNVMASTEVDGIVYYVNEGDDWFFNGYDLEVDYDSKRDEPIYHFHEQSA
ncbi:iron-sulfur cluster biosynthesis protein [Desemzia sp. RIT804]|uniref:HesB/YadR/YfhF family protein n=1 Tax=Desemzia sp. RIT 804 TaxID=2810209 RepID=UPI00195106EE|nr:iron-sulfur cluster biosynthesis protein [Desemzia sp. RIT 804]MBM6613599.1 iron-sulfur cluster biosynthesis protein [Desemzia sp. RIT 804]